MLLDWVPAHFPKDDFALRRFDGTAALRAYEDPAAARASRLGHADLQLRAQEIRSFLIANAVYWLRFHVDGLRVDAVASMLYLDYSRRESGFRMNSAARKTSTPLNSCAW